MKGLTDTRLFTALVTVMLAESIAALVWAGGAAARLHQLETQVSQTRELTERTARLEEQSKYIITSLHRIEEKFDDEDDQ